MKQLLCLLAREVSSDWLLVHLTLQYPHLRGNIPIIRIHNRLLLWHPRSNCVNVGFLLRVCLNGGKLYASYVVRLFISMKRTIFYVTAPVYLINHLVYRKIFHERFYLQNVNVVFLTLEKSMILKTSFPASFCFFWSGSPVSPWPFSCDWLGGTKVAFGRHCKGWVMPLWQGIPVLPLPPYQLFHKRMCKANNLLNLLEKL